MSPAPRAASPVLPALLALAVPVGLGLSGGCASPEPDGDGTGGGGASGGGGGPDDTAEAADDTATADPSVCEQLGLPERPWEEGATQDPTLQALAADLTLPTRRGDVVLSELWSGCESYLFLNEEPRQAQGYGYGVWDQDHKDLLQRLPANTHVFFLPSGATEGKRAASLDALEEEIERWLDRVHDTEEAVAWHRERIHYVEARDVGLDGWLGDIMQDPGWGAAVDRLQRVRYIGSYADYSRYDDSVGWFAPNLGMAANEAVLYNFEAEREAALEADGATVVPVFAGEQGSARVEVELPDPATIGATDTLQIDLTMACIGEGEFGTCPAWDYMAYLYMCDEPDSSDNPYADEACTAGDTLEGSCTSPLGEARTGTYTCREDGSGYEDLDCSSCDVEIARWITTYHREGRWVHDISPMLPLFEGGGSRSLMFQSSNSYELTGSLRFSDSGKEARPTHLQYILADGVEGSFSVPAGSTRVELATVISQHGQTCGEFCDATHSFTFNGASSPAVSRSFPEAGTAESCMDQVAEGTVANQYGTWWYGRAGWCPGKEVLTVTHDITSEVVIGGENTVVYEVDDASQAGTVRRRFWILSSE